MPGQNQFFPAQNDFYPRQKVETQASVLMFGLKRKSVIYMSISDHEWAQFMSKQIVLAISMQIFDGFYKTSWSRPDTRLNDRLFARILKYVRHATLWSLKFDMIDRIGWVKSCRESNSALP